MSMPGDRPGAKSSRRLGAQVSEVLLCPAQRVGEVARGVAGVGHLRDCSGDGGAGVGVVVGPDAVGVVLGVEPVAELVEQLRRAVDEQDEFGDEPVKLGRPGEGVGAAGAVVQFSDGLGGSVGELDGAGSGFGIGHGRPPLAEIGLATVCGVAGRTVLPGSGCARAR